MPLPWKHKQRGNCKKEKREHRALMFLQWQEAFGIRDLLKSCVGATPLQAGEAPMQRVVALPERTTYWLTRPNQNLLDMNTAVEIYYQVRTSPCQRFSQISFNHIQIGRDNPRYQTLLEVICQLIKDPLYNVLRTQEQLGI